MSPGWCVQRCIHLEISGSTSAMMGTICRPGWNMVKVPESLGVRTSSPCGYISEFDFKKPSQDKFNTTNTLQ